VGRPRRQSLDLSLVVVIGLVLSVSGAAFTAIAAMRSSWKSVVDEHRKDSAIWFESLGSSDDKNIKSGLKEHKSRFEKQIQVWDKSQWTPIWILGLVSVGIAFDVLWLDWELPEAQFFKARHWSWIYIYKWGLAGAIVVDAWAFFRAWRSVRVIRDASRELKNYFEIHEKQVAKGFAIPESDSGGDKP